MRKARRNKEKSRSILLFLRQQPTKKRDGFGSVAKSGQIQGWLCGNISFVIYVVLTCVTT